MPDQITGSPRRIRVMRSRYRSDIRMSRNVSVQAQACHVDAPMIVQLSIHMAPGLGPVAIKQSKMISCPTAWKRISIRGANVSAVATSVEGPKPNFWGDNGSSEVDSDHRREFRFRCCVYPSPGPRRPPVVHLCPPHRSACGSRRRTSQYLLCALRRALLTLLDPPPELGDMGAIYPSRIANIRLSSRKCWNANFQNGVERICRGADSEISCCCPQRSSCTRSRVRS